MDKRKVIILVCAITILITMKEVLVSNSELLKVARADAFKVKVYLLLTEICTMLQNVWTMRRK